MCTGRVWAFWWEWECVASWQLMKVCPVFAGFLRQAVKILIANTDYYTCHSGVSTMQNTVFFLESCLFLSRYLLEVMKKILNDYGNVFTVILKLWKNQTSLQIPISLFPQLFFPGMLLPASRPVSTIFCDLEKTTGFHRGCLVQKWRLEQWEYIVVSLATG